MAALFLLLVLGSAAFAANCPVQGWDVSTALEGSLAAGDCRLTDRIPALTQTNVSQQFILDVAAKGIYTIDLNSNDFDTILLLTDARFQTVASNEDASRNGSRITVHLAPETYHLFVIANRGTGAFRLEASFAASSGCSVREIAGTEFAVTVDNSLGASSCRVLDAAAPSGSAARADIFHFQMTQSRVLTALLQSNAIDPLLLLVDAKTGRIVASDDDGYDGFNSLLFLSLDPGEYYLVATLSQGTAGAYRLVSNLDPPQGCETRDLRAGDSASGQLTASDCSLLDLVPNSTESASLDVFRMTATDPGVLTVEVNSGNFVPAAVLLDSTGKLLAGVSSQRANQAARFSISLKPGEYRVGAVGAQGVTGSYQLRTVFESLRTCAPEPLVADAAVNGTLAAADCRVQDLAAPPNTDPTNAKPYQLTLEKRTAVTVAMTATALDPYLMVLGKDQAILAEDDNGGGGRNAQLTTRLEPGSYTVLANTVTAAGGVFELKASLADPRECPAGPLEFGELVTGQVAAEDCAIRDVMAENARSTPARFHTFTLTEPGSVSIDACSGAFLPALLLVDADGRRIASDEPSLAQFRGAAHIRRTLPAGTYGVVISATVGRPGAYTVRTMVRAAP